MKARNKPAIKRNSPQSASDDFTPEQIAEWREGVARRRHELFESKYDDELTFAEGE